MAVAIWDHRPTPQELLDRRMERGWRPTATATVEGDVVLGYAACAMGPGVTGQRAWAREGDLQLKSSGRGT